MTGIETVVDANAIDSEDTFNRLKGEKSNQLGSLLNKLLLRARINSQRHYEIYSINVDDSICEADLIQMFQESPQSSADLIRERGYKIYTDRVKEKVQVIV